MKSSRNKYGYIPKKTKQSKFWYIIVIVIFLLALAFVGTRIYRVVDTRTPQDLGVSETNRSDVVPDFEAGEIETYYGFFESDEEKENIEEVVEEEVIEEEVVEEDESLLDKMFAEDSVFVPEQAELPSTYEIELPFVSQAPYGEWDPLHEDACEEASMSLVYRHYNNLPINKETVEDDIQKNVAWQEERGYGLSITAEEVKTILKQYFNLDSYILENPAIDDLKSELFNDNLIIVPCAGRVLANPYYSGEGPLYHMLVLTGYDRNEFITHDVGTRRGEDYKYKYDHFIDSIRDWNGGDVYNGARRVIVILR